MKELSSSVVLGTCEQFESYLAANIPIILNHIYLYSSKHPEQFEQIM